VTEVTFSDAPTSERGPATRTDHGIIAPDRVDAFTSFIVEALVPDLRRRLGYRSLDVLVERASGDVRVVTTWDDSVARRAAADAFLPVLQRAAQFELRPIAIEES
jgi:hypothetical protein